MKRRIIPLLLVLVLVLAMLPVNAMAATTLQGDTDENGTVDVTLTISEGTAGFYTTKEDAQLFKEPLSVPYFDLALYGLAGYYYNPDCYATGYQTAGTKEVAEGVVTVMHVFIYATERFMMGYDPEDCGKGSDISPYISWDQGVGSTFMTFWNGSTDANYYVNYQYPLGRANWGSTSDQIALKDGDAVDVHLIKDGTVSGSQYSYFKTQDGRADFAQIKQGESLSLMLYETTSSFGDVTTSAPMKDATIYYINVDDYDGAAVNTWQTLGTTDASGKITVPDTLKAGKYMLSCAGTVKNSSERGPAAFRLTVKDAAAATYGDVNNSGTIDAYDASLILRYAAGQVEANTDAMDVDGSGTVDAFDANLVLRYAAGLITEFPKEG